ncbi:ATP-dependent DNA helicase [Halobacillus sp. Nhm2S1]|uniref:ATP-dependent DNA helicase n=1 Tax=Halobacillus sp. Nhm2S1 TaxID=2866716 RepID=UPI001C72A10D|nr:ATP-dependent DNA helicase [Halobacillus sp. Nhm2S1]MBX0358021.1 ATP-dependent DNA helicase [Halobacillus sp. Nhm2S1]
MDTQMTISVRDLVSYVYRTGSIDERSQTNTSLVEGTAIHQEVQKKYKEKDESEVFLEYEFHQKGVNLKVQGRCDGLLDTEEGPVIDEIKSTSRDLEEIDDTTYPLYWAQAKGYAFIYAAQKELKNIRVQLTYVQKKTKEKKRILRTFTYEELHQFMEDTVSEYASYARILLHIREQKEKTVPDLNFPFPSYREGQRKLAGSVYRTVEEKRNLFAQAPTGIGKTISTLFPAIKALQLEGLERIYYLTAKTITRATAEEALLKMAERGLRLRSVTLTAKDKICFQEETICQPEYCEFADGYYDRINGAVVDILLHETQMTRSVIEFYARKHKVCPFEFSLDLTDVCDVIIGDYNYIFDPRVSLKRLMPDRKKKTALLVDESHNLVERAREMYSASVAKQSYERIAVDWEGEEENLVKVADAIGKDLERFYSRKEETIQLEQVPGELEENIERFLAEAESLLQESTEGERSEQLLDVYFQSQRFLKILEYVDGHYRLLGESTGEGDFILKLFCLDPSHVLRETTKTFRSGVFFSATLSPFAYYKEMLGGTKEDYILHLPSPYDPSQIDVMITPLSTRYKSREKTVGELTKRLQDQVELHEGNHLFFFPSYHYMEMVYREFKNISSVDAVMQERGMDEERREDFLAQFEEGGRLVGFAVLGGIFSEGVDLRGDRLNGVAVVGIGLAPRSFEKELIKDYFNQKGRNGYDYAYVYPGMNKVLQAGGRLIRSEEDHGSIQLVDDRFLSRKYLQLLPDDWGNYRILK